jgi:hypothetical protein
MIKKLMLFFVVITAINSISAQTSGTLKVSTTTNSTGGNYAPNNIVAIWIENENGKFVKTLAAYANVRKQYLYTWKASTTDGGSLYNIVDAVTGATRTSHGTINCSWNGTDYKGAEVGDGTYKLRFELTDKHSQGNLASYSFSKGNVSVAQTPADVPSFTSTSIKWEPTLKTGIYKTAKRKGIEIKYNPASGQLSVLGVPVKKVEVFNYAGQLVFVSSSSISNLNSLQDGVYLIAVKTDTKLYSKKIMKLNEIH